VNLIFGAVIDQAMKDEVRITVIATGFDGIAKRIGMPANGGEHKQERPKIKQFPTPSFDPSDLDIPAFLRRNR
jgi:cell division protein FtsZ